MCVLERHVFQVVESGVFKVLELKALLLTIPPKATAGICAGS